MEVRIVCLLFVMSCAFVSTYAMAVPSMSNYDEPEALEEASHMANTLETLLDFIRQRLTDDEGMVDEDETSDTFDRRRRMLSGMHSTYRSGSGRRYRGRPRVYIPRRRRPGNKAGSRNNVSPY